MDSGSFQPRQRYTEMSSESASSGGNLASTTKPSTVVRRSPFLPTSLETILLSIYPSILIIGSIFSVLDPTTRNAPYNSATQSHYSATAPSYFAKKSNVFNQFFVKQGWAWITFSYFFFLFTHPSTGPPLSAVLTPRRFRGGLRYISVTLWWIFVTQWFFGPPLIDRGFTLTGGQCELVREADKGNVAMDDTRQFVTGFACKAVGGKWKGGHDISGHVFLLVLGSMFLLEEVLHVILRNHRVKEERTILMGDGAVKSAEIEVGYDDNLSTQKPGQWTIGAKLVLGVAGASIYMLLMTAAYFHTWFEKAFYGITRGINWDFRCIFPAKSSSSP